MSHISYWELCRFNLRTEKLFTSYFLGWKSMWFDLSESLIRVNVSKLCCNIPCYSPWWFLALHCVFCDSQSCDAWTKNEMPERWNGEWTILEIYSVKSVFLCVRVVDSARLRITWIKWRNHISIVVHLFVHKAREDKASVDQNWRTHRHADVNRKHKLRTHTYTYYAYMRGVLRVRALPTFFRPYTTTNSKLNWSTAKGSSGVGLVYISHVFTNKRMTKKLSGEVNTVLGKFGDGWCVCNVLVFF